MSNTSTIICVLQHTFDMEPKKKSSLNKRYKIHIIVNQMATYFSISVGAATLHLKFLHQNQTNWDHLNTLPGESVSCIAPSPLPRQKEQHPKAP